MMMTNEAQTSAVLSVGERLRAARAARGLELRDMAAVTKIQSGLLADLEGDRFDEFPAEVFARGFLKNYARELRLDEDEILEQYRAQLGLGTRAPVAVVVEEPLAQEATADPLLVQGVSAGRALYAGGLALVVFALALSVLVFGRADDGAASANYQPADFDTAWEPVPAGQDDWQTYREN